MDSKKFIRTKEDFVCGHCGASVQGNGFTNHCPKCLWSKHVDINPGDRAAECQGLMQPVSVEKSGDTYSITHQCSICGYEKRNKVSPEDDFELVINLAQQAQS